MINVKKEGFLKKLFLFLCVFGQQKNRTNEAGEAQKAQDTALKAADSKKGAHAFEGARDWSGNELPTERWCRAKRQLCLG